MTVILPDLTLREWLAGQALAGILAGHAGDGVRLPDDKKAAKYAVEYADAVIAELDKATS